MPEKATDENLHKDRWDLGALATHMLSQSSEEPSFDASQQRVIAMSSLGRRLDAKCEPSPALIDFLEACFMQDGTFDKVLKVSNQLPEYFAVAHYRKASIPSSTMPPIINSVDCKC